MRLRIAFVDYILEPDKPGRTGLSDIVWDMARALTDLGHEAHVIASYNSDTYPDPRVTVHNFKAPPMGYRNVAGNIWLLKRAASIVAKIAPDIIHAPEYVSTAVFATLRLDIPIVLTVPGNIYRRLETGHGYAWHYVQVLKWAAKVSARECDAIIAISTEMKRWWERIGSPTWRTRYIPYGVDTERFYPVSNARQVLGLDPDRPLFLFLGRFYQQKGIFDLVNSIYISREILRKNNAQFVLIGAGPDGDALVERINALDLGDLTQTMPWLHQEELKYWYSAAKALLLPSWDEPLGRVILESMACSTPVIASKTEGPKDHITEGQTGYRFSVGDSGALASFLGSSVEEKVTFLAGMRPACKSHIAENYTWDKIARRIVDGVLLART